MKAQLGFDPAMDIRLRNCDDPRITRIATACLLARSVSIAEIASQLGEPEALVERIRTVHEEASRLWLLPGSRLAAVCYDLAGQDQGLLQAAKVAAAAETTLQTVYALFSSGLMRSTSVWTTHRKGGYQLKPCECGSLRRAPMRLREVSGPICLACRVDVAGVEWPADPYDRYLVKPTPKE